MPRTVAHFRSSAVLLLWLSVAPAATITGIITDPDGHPVGNAAAQAKGTATQTIYKTVSAPSGKYTLAQLPAGTYELTIPPRGISLAGFEKKRIVLQSAQTLRLDIRLDWGPNLGTQGDDSFAILAALRRSPPPGPAPRTPEGRPDLSGVWIGNSDPAPQEPVLLPWAAAVVKTRAQFDKIVDNPTALCLPNGVPLAGPGIYKFVQTPALLITMFEDTIGYRQVFLDGRAHPKDWSPSWTGHSIGQWQGEALVVDTTGFHDRSWLQLYPHTEQLHITESYRRLDAGHLEVLLTIEDPGTFSKPWKIKNVWDLAPNEDILEYVCNENNKSLQHSSAK